MKFQLNTNCKLVRGAKRSTICDLQRNKLFTLSLEYSDIIESWKGKTKEETRDSVGPNFTQEQFNELHDFLNNNDLCFYTKTPERFPELSLEFHTPFTISNAIIDYDKESNYDMKDVLRQLSQLHCEFLQIRFFYKIRKKELESILQYIQTKKSTISGLELVVSTFDDELEAIIKLRSKYARISSIIIHNSNKEKFIPPIYGKRGYVILTDQNLDSEVHCGVISPKLFAVNIETYTEGLSKNSCLNGKISVDKEGFIKNCPSMKTHFGHVSKFSLVEALEKKNFKELWAIHKDKIKICQDCEFRRVCTDCRAYIKTPNDSYSKPLKCNYNPYTAEWEQNAKTKFNNVEVNEYC